MIRAGSALFDPGSFEWYVPITVEGDGKETTVLSNISSEVHCQVEAYYDDEGGIRLHRKKEAGQ